MSKFKVGDKIRRVGVPLECIIQFDTLTVKTLSKDGAWLGVEEYSSPTGVKTPFLAKKFELVQAATAESKYLTPQETLENLLTDVPTQAMHCGEWLDINELDNVSVNFLRSMKCRTKPSTVRVGEYEVVKPHPECRVTSEDYVYIFARGLGNVQRVQVSDCPYRSIFWDTREDAYAALQAIKKTLLGETK